MRWSGFFMHADDHPARCMYDHRPPHTPRIAHCADREEDRLPDRLPSLPAAGAAAAAAGGSGAAGDSGTKHLQRWKTIGNPWESWNRSELQSSGNQ